MKLGKIIIKKVVTQENNPNHSDKVFKSSNDKEKQSNIQIQPEIRSKSQKIGSLTLRGGLIGAIISSPLMSIAIVSIPFDSGFRSPLREFIVMFGLFASAFGLFLFTFIFYIGVIITLFNKIRRKEINNTFIKQFVTNKKIFLIVSLIVATGALSLIPQIFLLPFYGRVGQFGGWSAFAFPLNIGKDIEQPLLIEIVQGILTHPDLESGLLGRSFRLVAICVLIFTVFSLIWTLILILKDFKPISGTTTFGEFNLELCFTLGILSLLIFEIITPIWEFADPFGFGRMWWSSFLIILFVITPLSIFFLLFLITGNFENGYVVIGNNKIKSRALLSILFTLLVFGYSWLLVFAQI